MATTLEGPAEVAINEMAISPDLLSEVSVSIVEGTRERATLGGTFTTPSGILTESMATFTLFLPSMDYLKNIFPSRYSAPTAPQTTGNVIISSDTCIGADAGPVNIHFTCEDNDANDVYFYNAQAALNFNPTYSADAPLTVEVTLYANPDVNGDIVRMGTGDLLQESIYDPELEETVPVSSS